MPNPIVHSEDITIFNTYIQKKRLYQLLAGINDSYDKERRDLLNQDLLPTVEMAYATIRREVAWHGIHTHVSSQGLDPSEIRSGLAVKHRSCALSWKIKLTSSAVIVGDLDIQRRVVLNSSVFQSGGRSTATIRPPPRLQEPAARHMWLLE